MFSDILGDICRFLSIAGLSSGLLVLSASIVVIDFSVTSRNLVSIRFFLGTITFLWVVSTLNIDVLYRYLSIVLFELPTVLPSVWDSSVSSLVDLSLISFGTVAFSKYFDAKAFHSAPTAFRYSQYLNLVIFYHL